MKPTLTTEEIIRYVTLETDTPEDIRFVARIHGMMEQDEALRRKIDAFEYVYDSLLLPPEEARLALLLAEEEGTVARAEVREEG